MQSGINYANNSGLNYNIDLINKESSNLSTACVGYTNPAGVQGHVVFTTAFCCSRDSAISFSILNYNEQLCRPLTIVLEIIDERNWNISC